MAIMEKMKSAWLLEWFGNPHGSQYVKNYIAAVLPGRTPDETVQQIMPVLYANFVTSIQEPPCVAPMVRLGKKKHAFKVVGNGFGDFWCGSNPWVLLARKVYNLTLSEKDGFESLEWDQVIYPKIGKGESAHDVIIRTMPFPRQRRRFDAKTNTLSEVPARKKRAGRGSKAT